MEYSTSHLHRAQTCKKPVENASSGGVRETVTETETETETKADWESKKKGHHHQSVFRALLPSLHLTPTLLSLLLTFHLSMPHSVSAPTRNNWLNPVYTIYIHCIYMFIRCIYMHIPCTWVLLILCVYHFHVCLSVQPM
jgi:hypothetical protein